MKLRDIMISQGYGQSIPSGGARVWEFAHETKASYLAGYKIKA